MATPIYLGDFGLATKGTRNNIIVDLPLDAANAAFDHSHNSLTLTLSSNDSNGAVGTALYCAPESSANPADDKADMFSLGIILFEMCGAFKTGMERRESIELLKKEHEINETIHHKFPLESELILLMTNLKPGDRPTSQEVIDSAIFKKWKSEQE